MNSLCKKALLSLSSILSLASSPLLAHPNLDPAVILTNAYYPINTHWLANFSYLDYSLEMEDASRWQVVSSDTYIMSSWRQGDLLTITPNYNWFSRGEYYITNRTTNSYVRAGLSVGPTPFGSYSHWIVQIDHMSGHFTLENGITFCVNNKDGYIFREWEVNDHIILGTYDNCFSYYDHILINVNMDSYIQGKQY